MASTPIPSPAVVSTAASESRPPVLVPPEVSQAKLDRELSQWHDNADAYRRRGWILLSNEGLQVEVAFIVSLSIGAGSLPAVPVAIRLRYDNYDLWPPSLTFIDPRTGEPANPMVQAIELLGSEARNSLLIHPLTGRPFLCIPGLQEYHSHPQHTGDDWLLYRGKGPGRLAVVCDTVWRRMVRNIVGLQVGVQFLPGEQSQVNAGLAQGDIDRLGSTLGSR